MDEKTAPSISLTVFVAVVCALLGFLAGGVASHFALYERIARLEVEVDALIKASRKE